MVATCARPRWGLFVPRRGVTLLEALIVICVVGVLMALAMAAVQRARGLAGRAKCAGNLRLLGMAAHNYGSVHGKLPQGCAYPFVTSPRDYSRQIGVSWQTSILPFVEQTSLWDRAWRAQQIAPSGMPFSVHRPVMERVVPVFTCPTETLPVGHNSANGGWSWGLTNYLGVAGTDRLAGDGVFHRNLTVRLTDITDGTSNTLMIGERPAGPDGLYSGWYAEWGTTVCELAQILHVGPGRWQPSQTSCAIAVGEFRPGTLGELCDVNHYWSLHNGGANFAFADGSCRFITYSSAGIMSMLATRGGGEVAELD